MIYQRIEILKKTNGFLKVNINGNKFFNLFNTSMKQPIILIGGGGHCKACIDVIEQENRFAIKGIIDVPEKIGQTILGYPIIDSDKNLKNIVSKYKNFLITIGFIKNAELRNKLPYSMRIQPHKEYSVF